MSKLWVLTGFLYLIKEEEADKAIERKMEEAERLRKKAEAESLSLEETKEQIKSLEDKLKSLKADKHELFSQLKKVLNEDENRRRQQMKEKSELMVAMSHHHQYHPTLHMPGPHMIVQGAHMQGRPAMLDKGPMYRTPAQQPAQGVHGVKRTRSPSPPVVELYPQHPVQQGPYGQGPGYGQSQASHGSYRQGHQPYTTSQANSSYVSQSATGYPPGQQAVHAGYGASSQSTASKYQSRESAFSSYPNHFVPQQTPQAYQAQPHRYIHGGQSASAASIAVHQGQTVDQSVKQGPYPDDQGHYQHKLQGQHPRQMASAHPQALHPQQTLLSQSQVHLQAQQGKPSMPSSYTPRRKPESPIYQHKKPSQQHQQTQPQPHGTSYQSSQQAQRHGSYPTSQSQHQQGSSRYY
ncbi:glutenin, high molecular weight subunit DX5-like isoform X2 [Acanthaster planci]|uniref:Glutenin, high molecular weight subunit DX5-like isoform X2 n=1 Tax=Acanthaster planci TaxID=133434 RepID=A0A8B7Z6N8_ACAPL|nr:glutenin, high molecular weight subunit DX5-like isoform X2 [Acanthaster planci]